MEQIKTVVGATDEHYKNLYEYVKMQALTDYFNGRLGHFRNNHTNSSPNRPTKHEYETARKFLILEMSNLFKELEESDINRIRYIYSRFKRIS